jgi:YD repeat-containing protein
VDASSNTLTFTYDTNFCLVAVTDAIGQVTTLTYGLTNDIRKITKVTDPFGRYATFQYNGSGQLTNITDILGITSSFNYGSGDFINSLMTPYGTSTFAQGAVGRNRWLEATDPLGEKERMEYFDSNGSLPGTESVVPTGTGFTFLNNYMQYRNSFYWDKRAMQLYPNDLFKAKRYHWLHSSLGQTSGIKESVLEPLESRVWFAYAGQASTVVEGTNGQPSIVARVLDDGTSQITRLEYNSFGKTTKVTDPIGRISRFTYSTNEIDLLEVRQQIGTNAANTELLASFIYNSSHLPLTTVDAAGQTNYFEYNANGGQSDQ